MIGYSGCGIILDMKTVVKAIVEYIYPTDYDVQIEPSSAPATGRVASVSTRVAAVEPAASNCPPDSCIEWFESRLQKKNAGMALSHSCIFGPSGETRTRGILVPNQAPYQLGHTRILS